MYVTGLGKNNKPAWQFAAENGKRKRLCNFSHSRVSHTSAKYKGAIYVLGGQAYDAGNNEVTHETVPPVEMLCEGTNTWQYAGDLEEKL